VVKVVGHFIASMRPEFKPQYCHKRKKNKSKLEDILKAVRERQYVINMGTKTPIKTAKRTMNPEFYIQHKYP
jgi:hypothetical protein